MTNHNPNIENLIPYVKGQSGNPDGRPKGRRNLSTIVKELLEDDDFDWNVVPTKAKDFGKTIGNPWKAIVVVAVARAMSGDVRPMEWLRKAGYGDKLDIMSDGKRIEAPLIISTIKPRDVISETETTGSDRDSE